MSIIDLDYRKFCPKCGYLELTYIWENNENCPVCNTTMKRIKISDRIKFNNFSRDEIYAYIQTNIIKVKFDPEYVELRMEYQKKKHKEYQQQKKERDEKSHSKIQLYQAKYLEFLEEAQNQGILRSRAEDIATYAMQHEMYSLPHCPSCGSVDVSKIGTGTKIAKTAAFGIVGAMSDVGKIWKCNKCGNKW